MAKEKMNLLEKIMAARLEFLNSNPTKSGYNRFQNFKYFELVDIVPVATNVCCKLGIYTHINITEGRAEMIVINTENVNEKVTYQIDAPAVMQDKFNNMLQDVGRSETYLRRYLYMLFLDITENDTVDAADQDQLKGGNGFKRASQIKHKPKKKERVQAERIIKELEQSDDQPNLENAKRVLVAKTFDGTYTVDESNLIFKELEVLLNGTTSKANS